MSDLLPLPPETDPDGPVSHQERVSEDSRVWIDFERATLVEEQSHESLRSEAAVDPSPDPVGQETPGVMKAVVVAQKGSTLDREALLDWLRPRVARHQMPAVVEFRDELPYTSLGKPDKKALRG